MESFSAIPVCVVVVECGSFSLSSEQLGVTKSAVSKRISQLETKLGGGQLLQRSTRKLSLTEAGERYLDYGRNALTLANEGEDACLPRLPAGSLR